MASYVWEFWLGRGDRYWNWEFKGVDDSDYLSRIAYCKKIIEEVTAIENYYSNLVEDSKEKK